jgi:large repetitive protein
MTGWIAKKRKARSAKRLLLVALLTLLVSGAVTAWVALAANTPPPAPTISAGPANPTNQTSATFTYTDSQAVTKFQCSLDGAAFADCGTTRPSSKTYSGLAAGSHTFQVRAFVQQGNLTSSPTSYSWVVDQTAPTVVSINRAGANPTNAASVSWTVTFSESVTGVAIANFSLVSSGLSGSPAVTAVSGSGATWSVSASTGTGTPSGSGSLQLRLSSAGTIKDLAGNVLGGSLPVNGQAYTVDKTSPTVAPTITSGPSGLVNSSSATFAFSGEGGATFQCALESTASPVLCSSPTTYTGLTEGGHTFYVRQADAAGNVGTAFASRSWTIDTVPPPTPVLTNKPDDPNGDGLADFSWTDAESPVTFRCSLENGAFSSCTSPFHTILNISNSGQHQFAVRAYDVAGNFSETAYTWKVDVSMRFTITGNAIGLLAPGGGTTSTSSCTTRTTSPSTSTSCSLPSGGLVPARCRRTSACASQARHTTRRCLLRWQCPLTATLTSRCRSDRNSSC